MLEVTMASRCHPGAREYNEDYVQHGQAGSTWYAVLSDGAGGHSQGALASDMAVRVVAHALHQAPDLDTAALQRAVLAANDALNGRQMHVKGRQRMHATLVALWLDPQRAQAAWSHVGDSRLYWLRQGRVCHVTQDDSVVQQMVDAGLIPAAQARRHPHKNQLLAALGSEEPIEPHGLSELASLRDGDAFLLCSDGWWDVLEHRDIEEALWHADTVEKWLDAMEQQVRAAAVVNQDNFSAVGVWVGEPNEVTRLTPLE